MTTLRRGRSVSERSQQEKNYTNASSHADSAAMAIEMQPIGVVHSSYHERFATPRQACLDKPEAAQIHLNAGLNFEQAVQDLNGFSHIWVLYWMHLNQGWNPTVVPPRGPKVRRGLFSTRAPHRPNSIGLSAVCLKKVSGRVLHIEGHDMLDGTPILDIKPYIPYADAIPEASSGWLHESGLIEPVI